MNKEELLRRADILRKRADLYGRYDSSELLAKIDTVKVFLDSCTSDNTLIVSNVLLEIVETGINRLESTMIMESRG